MKIVINKCFGGFSISHLAMKRMAELQGRNCFFFKQENFKGPYIPVDIEIEVPTLFGFSAFDIPNPGEVLGTPENWFEMSTEERQAHNELWNKHCINYRPDDRSDPNLVQAVEELGCEAASGALAKLAIVEIPDGVSYEIDEYDGMESIHETHRSWG